MHAALSAALIGALCTAIAYDLEDPKADHYSKGIELDATGDIDGAVASFRAATRFTPNDTESWSSLGTAILAKAKSLQTEADGYFQHALDLFPKNEVS
jgi:Flp pilus assembly protein TadD